MIQEPSIQNSSGEAGRGRWCPSVECGIEHIFVFVGSLVLSRRLCSLVESDGQSGSYFRGTDNETGPEFGFAEITVDLLETRSWIVRRARTHPEWTAAQA